jgi:hypothetical protein
MISSTIEIETVSGQLSQIPNQKNFPSFLDHNVIPYRSDDVKITFDGQLTPKSCNFKVNFPFEVKSKLN